MLGLDCLHRNNVTKFERSWSIPQLLPSLYCYSLPSDEKLQLVSRLALGRMV